MYFEEINAKMKEIRSQNRAYISNMVYSKLEKEKDYSVVCHKSVMAVLNEEKYRTSALFIAADENALQKLLQELPEKTYIEDFHKEPVNEKESLFVENGFENYAKYNRVTTTFSENPYLSKEKGRRALLQEMYNPNRREYPVVQDAEEIFDLCMDVFDPTIDEIFSVEDWRRTIENKECVIVRENGKIVTLYKWRIEGKKLYGNISVNLGAANLLYDLERSVFDEYWEKGIRTMYAWINCSNNKALKRGPGYEREIVKARNVLYDTIYKKQ